MRELEVISAAECGIRWPKLMQVGRITRRRFHKSNGKNTTESVCFITSVPESASTAEQLLALNRGHWLIENSLHWVKDTVFREDQSTIRTKQAPRIASAMRNFALYLTKNINPSPTLAREICNHNKSIPINAIIKRT